MVYSPPPVDRIWLGYTYNMIPVYPTLIFYLLKGDSKGKLHRLGSIHAVNDESSAFSPQPEALNLRYSEGQGDVVSRLANAHNP